MFGMAFKPRDCGGLKIHEIEKLSNIYSLEVICNLHWHVSTDWEKMISV